MEISSVRDAKRIVVKVGTSTLTHDTGKLHIRRMEILAQVISDLLNSGREIILVSSGAVAAGLAKSGLEKRPDSREGKQALAAIGQCELMNMYERFFANFGYTVAQVLLTKDVLDNETPRTYAENTFRALLAMGSVPIVNENDTISYEGIRFGGNDTLSAYVALLVNAELLINLSDIDGLYNRNPRTDSAAQLIKYVDTIDERILSYAGGEGTQRGTGGMIAKLEAAQIAGGHGIPMIIANGKRPEILYDILYNGDVNGTYFRAPTAVT